MALLHNSGDLGKNMPSFSLNDVYGKTYNSGDCDAEVMVVLFICGHCPYVQAIEERLVNLAHHFSHQSVELVGICSNDTSDYPEDSPQALKERVERLGIPFNYLIDETQEVARDFSAVCTPDIFVFDKTRRLRYHGQLDDNWKNPSEVTREDLKLAIESLLSNTDLGFEQVPTMGCSIKWKKDWDR